MSVFAVVREAALLEKVVLNEVFKGDRTIGKSPDIRCPGWP